MSLVGEYELQMLPALFCDYRVWCKYSNELYDIVINQYYG